VHLNRIIKSRDLNVIYICGPGHGGPAMVANTYLEGSYSEIYPEITQDGAGMQRLFRRFSFPGGVPSHAAPETPGSMHEGGELGYSLAHAYGAAFDNPDLIVACVVGDGEAETGPLSASWRCNAFLNPASDGAVLPILHLNGYKIANPTILGRLPDEQVVELFRAYGYEPLLVAGSDPNLTPRSTSSVRRIRRGTSKRVDEPRREAAISHLTSELQFASWHWLVHGEPPERSQHAFEAKHARSGRLSMTCRASRRRRSRARWRGQPGWQRRMPSYRRTS
jgi:xylulose-5-phosphate/fructose-6-phosphate phosphoketolase